MERRPTLTIFFANLADPPPPKYSMFSKFQCFFSMFFHLIHLIFLDSCTDSSEHELIRCISCLKVFCAQIFTRRNIHGKLLKAVSFVIFIVTSHIIVGIGAYKAWAHTCMIPYFIDSLLNAVDIDGGLRTATGTSKSTLRKDLICMKGLVSTQNWIGTYSESSAVNELNRNRLRVLR